MNARTQNFPESVDNDFQFPCASEKPRSRVRLHHDFLAHSTANITSWRCYLPDDCIAAMIKMGWDRTT
jgi:hypothetical protein